MKVYNKVIQLLGSNFSFPISLFSFWVDIPDRERGEGKEEGEEGKDGKEGS